jgi:heme exporter protein A
MTYLGHLNGLKDELTGLENLQISSRLAGQNVSEAEISDVLARLGVEECQDLPTKVLSQGQKKRMALARFWLHRAALWVLDEPFTALDVHGVDILLSQISDHVAAGGMVVLTSHQDVELGAGEIRHIHLS